MVLDGASGHEVVRILSTTDVAHALEVAPRGASRRHLAAEARSPSGSESRWPSSWQPVRCTTRSRTVAATVAIDADGPIAAVGGVHEKAIAARDEVLLSTTMVSMHAQAVLEAPLVAADVPVVYLPGPPWRGVSPLDSDHTDTLVESAYEAARVTASEPRCGMLGTETNSPQGGNSGVWFAIPIDFARSIPSRLSRMRRSRTPTSASHRRRRRGQRRHRWAAGGGRAGRRRRRRAAHRRPRRHVGPHPRGRAVPGRHCLGAPPAVKTREMVQRGMA